MALFDLLLGGIGGGLSAIGQAKAAKTQAKSNELTQAIAESGMNPFRDALAQGAALQRLDRATGTEPRAVVQRPNGYSTIQGGTYAPSPELLSWLGQLQQKIASGQRNPLLSPQSKSGTFNLNAGNQLQTSRNPYLIAAQLRASGQG